MGADSLLPPKSARSTAAYRLALAAGVALLYFLSARLSRALIVQPQNIAAIWPPSGLALAALLLLSDLPSRLLAVSGIFIASFLANLITGAPIGPSLGFALANSTESILAVAVIIHFIGVPLTFERLRDVIGLVGLVCVGTNGLAALLGAGAAHMAFGSPFWATWLTWWSADGLGTLLIGVAILSFAAGLRSGEPFVTGRQLEFTLLCAITIGAAILSYAPLPAALRYPYMLLLPLLWAATRFGPRGTITVALLLASIVLGGTLAGRGLFVIAGAPVVWHILGAQIFLGVMISAALLLAASRSERAQAQTDLTRANSDLQDALSRAQALYTITSAAIRSDNLGDALQHAVDLVSQTVGADRVMLLVFDWDEQRIVHFVYSGRGSEHVITDISVDEFMSGLTGWAIRERRAAVSPKGVPDPRESAESQRRRIETECGAVIVAPLFYLSDAFGTLTAINRPDQPNFSDQDVNLLQAIAGQIAIAYARTRLTEQLRRANGDLQREIAARTRLAEQLGHSAERAGALAEVSRTLAEVNTDLQTLYERIAHHAVRLLGDACIITRLTDDGAARMIAIIDHRDPARRDLMRAAAAKQPRTLAMDEGLVGQVIRSGQPLVLQRLSPEDAGRYRLPGRLDAYADQVITAGELIVPVLARGRTLGTIGVTREGDAPAFGDDDLAFLQALADRAGLAIENARLFAEAEQARQEAEQANSAKSAFLASMSHELRTPLNAILGFTGTLLMQLPGPLNATQEKQLGTIKRSAQHLLALINDILDLARIESGRVEIRLTPVVCQDVLDDIVDSLRPLAEQRGLAFTIEAPAAPLAIQSDSRALGQILINLVNNAIKFTDAGEVRVHLRPADGAGGAIFAISDSGIGIRPADQARLFQEFGRVDSPEVRTREGTGLGLRLSLRLAHLLGGDIAVHSEYGVGSTFTLRLPGP